MQKRFTGSKRRRGAIALSVIIIVAGITGAFAAFGANNAEAINNIALLDAGNSYNLKGGKLILSYNHETTAEAPLTLYPSGSNEGSGMKVDETGFYISKEITAIAYGGFNGEPVQVLISGDMGKTWNTYTVAEKAGGSRKYVGFITKNDGWLVLCSFRGMGNEDHYIYKTADGGKTWTEVLGNANDTYARVLTGAGFANENIGFLSFRYESIDFQPAICRTQDGGLTWEKLFIILPKEFDEYSKTPLSPVFYGANGLYPILLSKDGADNVLGTIYLTSKDYGKTWIFEKHGDLKELLKALETKHLQAVDNASDKEPPTEQPSIELEIVSGEYRAQWKETYKYDTLVLIDNLSDWKEFLKNHPAQSKYEDLLLQDYNDEFFKHSLIYAYVKSEGSGSNELTVKGTELNGDKLKLFMIRTVPGNGTSDMATRICLFGLKRDKVKNVKVVEGIITEKQLE
ncbi:MAG: WD40/YVTN/BNR-like repeat-containing protein [Syntrophothermus sp.]